MDFSQSDPTKFKTAVYALKMRSVPHLFTGSADSMSDEESERQPLGVYAKPVARQTHTKKNWLWLILKSKLF